MDNAKVKFECACTYIVCFDIKEFLMDYLNKNQTQSKDFKICCAYHKNEQPWYSPWTRTSRRSLDQAH